MIIYKEFNAWEQIKLKDNYINNLLINMIANKILFGQNQY